MLSNIVSVVALAGAAMAACPLSVEITNASGHVTHVAVTNTASQPVTVFKGNTVLTGQPTKNLEVSDASGKAIPFSGAYVKFRSSGIASDMFQTIQPGETVNTVVNAATTHKLDGLKQAKVAAVQGFHYVMGADAPTALRDTEYCQVTSNTVAITPDHAQAVADHLTARDAPAARARNRKRAVMYSGCDATQVATLMSGVNNAVAMAEAAVPAVPLGLDYFVNWFKSILVAPAVASIYTDVAAVQVKSPNISCIDPYNVCGATGAGIIYAVPQVNLIAPCPSNGFWGFPELASTCAESDVDRAGSILHAITHLYGTHDHSTTRAGCLALSSTDAVDNAETYEIYANSVRLGGCPA